MYPAGFAVMKRCEGGTLVFDARKDVTHCAGQSLHLHVRVKWAGVIVEIILGCGAFLRPLAMAWARVLQVVEGKMLELGEADRMQDCHHTLGVHDSREADVCCGREQRRRWIPKVCPVPGLLVAGQIELRDIGKGFKGIPHVRVRPNSISCLFTRHVAIRIAI